jgi:hypothetical protein
MHPWWPHLFSFPRALDPISWLWLSTRGYAFTSSGLQLTIPAGLLVYMRRHNCHARRCWRLGRRTHGDLLLCHKHHPKPQPNADDIR